MTTHATARTTDRPIPSPFTGAGKLWRATFLSHILNPWNMAFALAVPMFMYAMFGMTDVARATQTGRGNLAAADDRDDDHVRRDPGRRFSRRDAVRRAYDRHLAHVRADSHPAVGDPAGAPKAHSWR